MEILKDWTTCKTDLLGENTGGFAQSAGERQRPRYYYQAAAVIIDEEVWVQMKVR